MSRQDTRTAKWLGRKLAVGALLAGMVGWAAPAAAQIFDPGFSATTNGTVQAVAVQADGKVLLGGSFTQVNGVARAGLARLNADGSLDTSFTTVVTGGSGLDYSIVYAINVLSDGHILVAGNFFHLSGVAKSHIARLNSDGSIDSTFTASVTNDQAPAFGVIYTMLVQPDGKIVIGGDAFNHVNGAARLGLARLNADGTLDGAFAPSFDGAVYTLAIQADAAIVVGGYFTQVNGIARRKLARLNAAGSLDTTFNSPISGNGFVGAVAVRTDSRILVGGSFTLASGGSAFAQLNADGSPDATFNVPVLTAQGVSNAVVNSIVLQADGRILIGGFFRVVDGVNTFAAARLFSDGTFDSGFGTTGGGSNNNTIAAIALQPDGKALIGGAFGLTNVARLLPGVQPVIAQVAPTSGQQGQANFNIVVTGQSTHFVQGTTTASFGAGITVNSTTVQSATQATANVTIAPGAALGARAVTLTTGGEIVSLAGGFTVTAGPALSLVSPNRGRRSQTNLVVSLAGQFTHFAQGQTTANFGAGITVNGTTVQSATQATASVTIAGNAALGPRTVTLTTGGEVVALSGGFVVTALTLTTGDFDGDGKADITVFRPSTGDWYVLHSNTNNTTNQSFLWGLSTDTPVPGDYDGDGTTDIAVYRPSNGTWYILQSSTNFTTFMTIAWGTATDVVVQADYDGDGRTDIGVYRPSNGAWYILQSSTSFTTFMNIGWGTGADVVVQADYDGDGRTDIAVFRPSTGAWFILKSSSNFSTFVTYSWGAGGDVAVPGDYDGDGKADVAIFRPSASSWYILQSIPNYTAYVTVVWGAGADVPVPGDFDGDGKTDPAIFRPSTGLWAVLKSSTNYTTSLVASWGVGTDTPILKRP